MHTIPVTTDSSFDEIEKAIRNAYSVFFPDGSSRPSKPQPISIATAEKAREFAAKMEQYEQVKAKHDEVNAQLSIYSNELYNIWKEKHRNEYSHLPDEIYNLIYQKSYEQGHSSGLGEVRNEFYDECDFAEKIIAASKK